MTIKTRMTISLLCSIITILYFTGCGSEQKNSQMIKKRDSISKNARPFNAAYFKDAKRSHVAVFYEVKDGKLAPSQRPAEVRPGNMPYRSKEGGSYMIRYSDESGKMIGKYYIENPAISRTCDFDYENVGAVSLNEGAIVEILLPHQTRIETLEIVNQKNKAVKLDIQPYRKLIRERTN